VSGKGQLRALSLARVAVVTQDSFNEAGREKLHVYTRASTKPVPESVKRAGPPSGKEWGATAGVAEAKAGRLTIASWECTLPAE
jgi:hypothetical protein